MVNFILITLGVMEDIGDVKAHRKNLMYFSMILWAIAIFSDKIVDINLGIMRFGRPDLLSPLLLTITLIIQAYLLIRYCQIKIYDVTGARRNILAIRSLQKIKSSDITYIKQINETSSGPNVQKFDKNKGEGITQMDITNNYIEISTDDNSFHLDEPLSNLHIIGTYNYTGIDSRVSFRNAADGYFREMEIHFHEFKIQRIRNLFNYWIEEKYFADYVLPLVVGGGIYTIILMTLIFSIIRPYL